MNKSVLSAMMAGGVLLLAGCASQPKDIQVQSVSSIAYDGYNCTQVGTEMSRVNDRITGLYAQLKSKADNDAAAMVVGMVLFWPALFLLEGGDGAEASEYGRLRGEMDALQQAGVRKSCEALPSYEDPIKAELDAKRASEAAAAASGKHF